MALRIAARLLVALLPLACTPPSDSDPILETATGTPTTGGSDEGSEGDGNEEDGSDEGETTGNPPDTTTRGEGSGSESGSESGEACGDIDNDPTNCGECGNVCDAPSHGAPACVSGSCDVECDSGYHPVDLSGSLRCSKFAGFFLRNETGTCEAENPFTGDCSCPTGFDDRPVTSWRITPGDGTSWVQLAVCSPVAGDPTDAWGGMFAQYESDDACAFPNPLNTPLCVCPDGYTATSQWRGANINGDAIRISFCTEDTFESDALFTGAFTETGAGGCATTNCTCPAGTTQVDYPTMFEGAATTSSFCYQP